MKKLFAEYTKLLKNLAKPLRGIVRQAAFLYSLGFSPRNIIDHSSRGQNPKLQPKFVHFKNLESFQPAKLLEQQHKWKKYELAFILDALSASSKQQFIRLADLRYLRKFEFIVFVLEAFSKSRGHIYFDVSNERCQAFCSRYRRKCRRSPHSPFDNYCSQHANRPPLLCLDSSQRIQLSPEFMLASMKFVYSERV